MSLIDSIKEKVNSWKAEQQERKAFQKLVEQETKPLRRAGYLEEKKRTAIEEGKLIAQRELEKKKQLLLPQKQTTTDFGIPDMSNYFKSSNQSNKSKINKS